MDNWKPVLNDIPRPEPMDEDQDADEWVLERRHEKLWEAVRWPVHPQVPKYELVDYNAPSGTTLRERFREGGLQIIVKMATIELTPETPHFPEGGWHVEGQMNEHIVGTAIYYLDSENITPSHLSFRMQTGEDHRMLQDCVEQDRYGWLEVVYGTELGANKGVCLQSYGKVETKEGRLLAFPNVFHHRVCPFELADKSKPGHRRIIALWLVDPLTRIISTANVPPQQRDWWLDDALAVSDANAKSSPYPRGRSADETGQRGTGGGVLAGIFDRPGLSTLPQELLGYIRRDLDELELPMTLAEARAHRLELMGERTTIQQGVQREWQRLRYNFCEH